MDHYSILDNSSSAAAPKPAPVKEEPIVTPAAVALPVAPEAVPKTLQFPGEDGGRSLAEMAERDLEMTLQLLAERAHYITGAAGAAIALRHGEEMICRASAGPAAPEVGAQLQVNSGLTGESVRTRQLLRCDDSGADTRVNRESCQALGIASVVVMPLVREDVVNGVFELLSGRAYAFEERDITALQRLGEMVQTAVEHAKATVPAEGPEEKLNFAEGPIGMVAPVAVPETELVNTELENEEAPVRTEQVAKVVTLPAASQASPAPVPPPASPPVAATAPPPEAFPAKPALAKPVVAEPAMAEALPAGPPKMALGHIGKCKRCGFPVSEGRTQCLDCDAAYGPDKSAASASSPLPFSYGEEEEVEDQRSWLRRNAYWIGMAVVTAGTIALLVYVRM